MYTKEKVRRPSGHNGPRMINHSSLHNTYSLLFRAIDYHFRNINLLIEALTRRSAVTESVSQAWHRDYQRLEFLGDRVLNFFVMRLLVQRNFCVDNKELNDLKIRCVSNNDHLIAIAKKLELHKYIIRGRGERNITDKMYADALEALLGAIYLDNECNDECMFAVVRRLFIPYLPILNKKKILENVPDSDEESEHSDNESGNSDVSSLNLSDDDFDELIRRLDHSRVSTEHFDQGAFQFKKIVLNWGWGQITKPLAALRNMLPLPSKFVNKYAIGFARGYYDEDDFAFDEDPFSARETYFKSFEDLILEESRATLAAGVEAHANGNAPLIKLTVTRAKQAKNTCNPSVFFMQGKLPREFDYGTSNIGLLLIPNTADREIKLLGLASYKERELLENVDFEVKVVVPEEEIEIFGTEVCRRNASWNAYVLGSLVTQQRMYEVCKKRPEISFGEQIYSGKLYPLPKGSKSTLEEHKEILNRLNIPQRMAVLRFLRINSGLQILQGPPGTGKTTTIITLLQILCVQNKRVLVCAASNKGVQVIVRRLLQLQPDACMILSGVKKKLAPELEEIFLHTWGDNICFALHEQILLLKQLIADSAPQEGDIKQQLVDTSSLIRSIIEPLQIIAAKINRIVPNYYATKRWVQLFLVLEQMEQTQPSEEIKSLATNGHNILSHILYRLVEANQINDNKPCSDLETAILKHVNIVFSTLSTSGRGSIQNMQNIDVLIIDEASQTVEAETLIPFALNPDKCLLVGDTKQLPATVLSQPAIDKKFDRSMMYRLVEECEQPCGMLTVQYRMHPEIRRWPSEKYYGDKLEEDDSFKVAKLDLPEVLAPCTFINIDANEQVQGHSCFNSREAEYVIRMLRYLKANGVNLSMQVGVITFYAEQVKYLNRLIEKDVELWGVTVNSVDGFQGEERDFIVVSFVRANSKRQIGFLRDYRRLNVAITRARAALVMLGNIAVLESKKSDVAELIENMRQRNLLFTEQVLEQALNGKNMSAANHADIAGQSPIKYLDAICRPLSQSLNYQFNNPAVLRTALTRTSAIEEKLAEAAEKSGWHAKLLGEHFLKLALAVLLLNKYSAASEEQLHNLEASFVINSFLAKVASVINLHKMVIRGAGETEMSEQMYADALRTIFGAVYLDAPNGAIARKVVTQFCERYFFSNSHSTTTTKEKGYIKATTSTAKPDVPKSMRPTISRVSQNPRYKTAICVFFKAGHCPRGNKCMFAHGESELRGRRPQ